MRSCKLRMEKKCKCDLKVRWLVSDRNQLNRECSETSLSVRFGRFLKAKLFRAFEFVTKQDFIEDRIPAHDWEVPTKNLNR